MNITKLTAMHCISISFYDAEDFYDEHYDDFFDFEDAEDYWYDHGY